MRPHPTTQRGFTVIELMAVVVIVGILIAIGAPNLQDFVVRSRVKTASTDLHFALTFARSEAVKRNAQIDVVPVNASDWSQGWSVRSGGTTLSQYQAYENVTFTSRDATCTAAAAAPTVSFAGTGRSTSATGNCFVLTATNRPTIPARCVMISPSGRPNVRFDKDADPSDGCV
jgi:type IV fimbrial biogenesis protein FimT